MSKYSVFFFCREMGKNVNELLIRGLKVDWGEIAPDSYLRRIGSIQKINALDFHRRVTFFVGENGSGKSTLLEAMAVSAGFNPEGGTFNYRFTTRDSHSELYGAMSLIRSPGRPKWGYFLRAESFYNVATAEEEYSRLGGIPRGYHLKSHGESFLATAQDNFRGGGLYFLDEPEAALSPQRQLTLIVEIARCVKENAQFFIVTHSPILLGIPDAEILSFDGGPIHPVSYEETDSYRITEMFLRGREQLLKRLLEED